ncbi:hypothetical protein GGD56_007027 [Rhizobium mongolense]|uniref:Uncharacterized protein n=1 Tax=Rhizobium mongolense TaxID=57676 RepID=A0ABR6IYY2_9HYPH|nr:hypothetical protein [Rhizobium mongolense]
MSVIMRFSARPCFLSSRVSNRFAVLVFAPGLDDFIEDITVLVDRPPQPVFPAADGDDDLIEMPDIILAGRFTS